MSLILIATCIVAVALLALDWKQTLRIAKLPEPYHETNWVLGRHPSDRRIGIYFSSWIAATILVAIWFPAPLGLIACAIMVVVEGYQTTVNVLFFQDVDKQFPPT